MEMREAAKSEAKEPGCPDLKPEQLDVVETFMKERGVFAVLPTGYGKSLFQLPTCYVWSLLKRSHLPTALISMVRVSVRTLNVTQFYKT